MVTHPPDKEDQAGHHGHAAGQAGGREDPERREGQETAEEHDFGDALDHAIDQEVVVRPAVGDEH